MKLTNEQVARYEKAYFDHMEGVRRDMRAEVIAETEQEREEAMQKAESAFSVATLALLLTAAVSGFLFKLLVNLGAAKFVVFLVAIVCLGAFAFSIFLMVKHGISRKPAEEILYDEEETEEERSKKSLLGMF